MTKEEIIRMAEENGIVIVGEAMFRFAALVAAHVRKTEFKPDWANYRQGLVDGAAAEREACAQICEAIPATWTRMDYDEACMECAKAIRSRRGDA